MSRADRGSCRLSGRGFALACFPVIGPVGIERVVRVPFVVAEDVIAFFALRRGWRGVFAAVGLLACGGGVNPLRACSSGAPSCGSSSSD